MRINRLYKILILILLVAAVLRFFGLSRGDTVNDEVFYAFKAIGLMDYDVPKYQTTPLQWWDPSTGSGQVIPSWTKLSFHDHPPLVFWIQHFFIKVFGENNFAFRLPSVLLGVGSVYLVFLIGRILFSANVGLLSAALLSVTLNHVYISRLGLQEAYVIFFMLLASYFFLKGRLILTGIILGLAFLTKYTTFILVPIFLTYLLFFRRDYFLNKKFWIGTFLSILIFSPVIIYNIQLYRAVGHFDFQISHIIGQVPGVWEIAPGKEIGTLWDRAVDFIPRMVNSNSWLFLLLFAASFVGFVVIFTRNFKETLKTHSFLIITLFYLIILILLIGPSYRFLTMLTPWIALGIGVSFWYYFRAGFLATIFLIAIFAFEIFYSYNNLIAYYPKGPEILASSPVRYENYNYGYNALNDFLREEFRGKMPALIFEMKYKFLEEVRDRGLEKAKKEGLEPYPALIVTYGNFDEFAKLWIFDRYHIYHGWPIINLGTYFQYLEEQGFDYYDRVGFRNFYFIVPADTILTESFKVLVQDANIIKISNPNGDDVFKVYMLTKNY